MCNINEGKLGVDKFAHTHTHTHTHTHESKQARACLQLFTMFREEGIAI